MRLTFTIYLVLYTSVAFGQKSPIDGEYSSVNNSFERWSVMILKKDGSFAYHYGNGGCQSIVTGKYTVSDKSIRFQNDEAYLDDHQIKKEHIVLIDSINISLPSPIYPDLSQTDWKIGKNYLKPMEPIGTGCLVETGKHRKIKF